MRTWLLWLALLLPARAQSIPLQLGTGSAQDIRLVQTSAIPEAVGQLGSVFRFPSGLSIRFVQLGRINAQYSPSNREIAFGYELLDHWRKLFAPLVDSPDELDRHLQEIALFTLYHEFGHALTREMVTFPADLGPPEEAADDFAVLMLAGRPDGQAAVEWAARWFSLENKRDRKTTPLAHFMDPHASMKDRGANLLALFYGSNPQQYAGIGQPLEVPSWRMDRGLTDYPKKRRMWLEKLKLPRGTRLF